MTGQQGMLAPPWHLIPSPSDVFRGPCTPIFTNVYIIIFNYWLSRPYYRLSPSPFCFARIYSTWELLRYHSNGWVWGELLYPTQRSCVGIMFLTRPSVRQSVRPCVIICCRQDSDYICWWIYTKLWEVVSNSKSMDGIDFQKNLSRGSLFLEGDLVKFVS